MKSVADLHESIRSTTDELCLSSPSGTNVSCAIARLTHSIVLVSVMASQRLTYGSNQAEKSITNGVLFVFDTAR